MKKKIFLSVFLSASAALAACLLLIMSVVFSYLESEQKKQLASQCLLTAQGVETAGMAYFDGFEADNFRVTLIASDGTVLYDTAADVSRMENHSQREEVMLALKNGTGASERYSDTLLKKNIYYAKRLTNSDVLRVSISYESVWSLLLGLLSPICFILLGTLILALVLGERVSEKIVRPLNNLNLESPLENSAYDEITPLLRRIEHLHRDIDKQRTLLERKRSEFSAVTDGMTEGLVLILADNTVASINRAAAALFNTDSSCIGSSFITVCRTTSVQNLISAAIGGSGGETLEQISGREYRISVSPVVTEDETRGVCLLTFDVTDKMQAERMRKEFTANVSHELKTPLHSILGTAELLHNGLVKHDDIPHFTEMIMKEASRLVNLVNDIIRLSQLDEAQNLPEERVDIFVLAREAADVLAAEAKESGVTVELHGESAQITGVRTLLYEIVYNLCDNAIRYNSVGGRVDVYVEKQNNTESVRLRVADTGTGIPAEHQGRIFERFYRVDKSRSRSFGGTGLGLSIVKHAAEYHHALIKLSSVEGKGTEVEVDFNADRQQ